MTWPTTIPGIDSKELTAHQLQQLRIATSGPVGVLSGGPGVGKSFSTAALIRAIQSGNPSATISVATPTGKAGQRITELMQEYGVSIRGQTIHRLLEPTRNGHDGDGWGFAYNSESPLPADFVITDESSMIDVRLMSELLQAIENGTRCLFVGDPHQLPPVGNGRPFADMIAGGIPHGHLTEIHRFAGRVAHVCEAIRSGQSWQPSLAVDLQATPPENFKHLERKYPPQVLDSLNQVVQLVQSQGFDPWSDLQVVCAVNEKSPLSRKVLNARMQGLLNPAGKLIDKSDFRIGDKVVCRKNAFLEVRPEGSWQKGKNGKPGEFKGGAKAFVANGEIGKIIAVPSGREMIVDFSTAFDPAKYLAVGRDFWKKIELAYAVTVHSAQGSQWPFVIVITDDYAPAQRIANRAWWYTALSRMQKLVITIGKLQVMRAGCKRLDVERRRTFLGERLKKGGAGGGEGGCVGLCLWCGESHWGGPENCGKGV